MTARSLFLVHHFGISLVMVTAMALSGCQTVQSPAPAPLLQPPVATHVFTLPQINDGVIGHVQVTTAYAEDTLADIARRFNIGYEEIVRANPSVDPWLPRAGTTVVVPTQFVLPDAPHVGVVVNLAALRLFYFPPAKPGEPQTVITHPIGIGQVGWSTPIGNAKIVRKKADPTWYPPASVRREHAAEGETLPAKIGPGPDNPLGKYAFWLDWPSYLIHGTNQPYGVGLRASHGCIRLYPEDIAQLFDQIPVGTKVTVVNQPLVYGYRGDVLYVQSYPVLEDYVKKPAKAKNKTNSAALVSENAALSELRKLPGLNKPLLDAMIENPNGIALPVAQSSVSLESVIATAPRVENRVPANATWNGVEE